MLLAVWCVAITVTAVRVHRLRGELAGLAADVAHHNAEHAPRAAVGTTGYLDLRLRTAGLSIRGASVRVVCAGPVERVEVRLESVVGFALVGHPRITVSAVRSAPVERACRLP